MMAAPGVVVVAADDEEEFEEFEGEHWPVTEKEDATLWDAEVHAGPARCGGWCARSRGASDTRAVVQWDNDEVDEEFAKKLQAEMEKMEAEKAERAGSKSPARSGGVE